MFPDSQTLAEIGFPAKSRTLPKGRD